MKTMQRVLVECQPKGAYEGAAFELRQFAVPAGRRMGQRALKAAQACHYATRYAFVETWEVSDWGLLHNLVSREQVSGS